LSSPTCNFSSFGTSTIVSTTAWKPPTVRYVITPNCAFLRILADPRRGLAERARARNRSNEPFERADNALKLIGDQYLSRVFGLASARFHLDEWQQSIRRKLDTVGDVYDLLVQQAGGRRMETLEIIVVALIALEIVLAVLRH